MLIVDQAHLMFHYTQDECDLNYACQNNNDAISLNNALNNKYPSKRKTFV